MARRGSSKPEPSVGGGAADDVLVVDEQDDGGARRHQQSGLLGILLPGQLQRGRKPHLGGRALARLAPEVERAAELGGEAMDRGQAEAGAATEALG